MASRHRARRRERGVAAVEFALVLPLFLVLIFGLIDFGRMMSDQIQLSSAAREGVRMAAMGQPNDITQRVDASVDSGMAAKLIVTPGPACPTSGPTPADQGTTVQVQYPFSFITPVGPIVKIFVPSSTLGGDVTLSSTASMRCEG